jgi:hypothetical protein
MSSFLLKKPDIFLQDNYLSNDFIITDKKQNKNTNCLYFFVCFMSGR